MGWDGIGGVGWDEMGWDGMRWDGTGGDGMGWMGWAGLAKIRAVHRQLQAGSSWSEPTEVGLHTAIELGTMACLW